MIQRYKGYLTKLGLITAGFYLVGGFLFYVFFKMYFSPGLLALPILFFILTFFMHHYLVKASKLEHRKFTSRFMAVLGVKILLLLVLLIVYVLLFPQQAVPFLVAFFIHYLVYTGFEVISVVNLLKSNPPKEK